MRGFRASRAAQQLHLHPQNSHPGQSPNSPQPDWSPNKNQSPTRTPQSLPDWLKTPETKAAERQAQKSAPRASLRLVVNNEKPKRKASGATSKKGGAKKTVRKKAA